MGNQLSCCHPEIIADANWSETLRNKPTPGSRTSSPLDTRGFSSAWLSGTELRTSASVCRGFLARNRLQGLKTELHQRLADFQKKTPLEMQLGPVAATQPLKDGIKVSSGLPAYTATGVYVGEWSASGFKHGRGIELAPDGSKYEGYFCQGRRNGYGRLVYANGKIYEGMFWNNQQSGKGTLFSPNGSKSSGQWKNNQLHGSGTEVRSDGAKYKGNFRKGQKAGFGLFEWPGQYKYRGSWARGVMHGQGQLLTCTGTLYEGEFVNGAFDHIPGQRTPK